MAADEPIVNRLIDDVLEGRAPDWAAAEAAATESQRPVIAHLRAVAAIASFNASRPDAAADSDRRRSWGHLQLLERVGAGAFGTVYRAWDPQLHREVALKLLAPGGGVGDAALEEGRLLARVRHPNVVTIYGADRVDGIVGLWMELIRGATLDQLIGRQGPMPVGRVIAIAAQLCEAVAAVHRAGLVHRDIKAHNVVVEPDGRVVLMDFGAGRTLSDVSADDVAGTPLYLAPEVFEGGRPTAASDQYSIAVLLYHLLTGEYPVAGRTLSEVRDAHAGREGVGDIRAIRPDVPRPLATALARALDPDPARRFDSVEALAAALTRSSRRRSTVAAGVALSAVIVALTIIATPGGRGLLAAIRRGGQSGPSDLAASGPSVRRLALPAASLYANGVSYDGRIYAFAAVDGSPAALDMASGDVETFPRPDGDGYAEFVIASPDGEWLAYDWWDRLNQSTIRLVNRRNRTDRILYRDPMADSVVPADWARDGSSIVVVVGLKDGPRRFVLVNADDGVARTVHEVRYGEPTGVSLSPDGRYLTYDLPDARNPVRRTLRIVPTDGGAERVLLERDRGTSRFPLWTPDGGGIFFISDRAGTPDGWVVPIADGRVVGDPQIAARNLARASSLGLTASGAFYYRLQDRQFEVYELPLDPRSMRASGAPHVVAAGFQGSNIGPSYSHDGRWLAYVSQRSELGGTLAARVIVVHDRETGQDRDLAPPLGLSVMAPLWSPDDTRLLVRGTDLENRWGEFVVDARSAEVTDRVVWPRSAETDYGGAAWSSDGAAILFVHLQQIIRHSLQDGSERVAYADRSTPPRRITRFAYTADGRLAYAAAGPSTSLSVVDPNGGARTVVTVARPQILAFQAWFPDANHLLYSTSVPGRNEPDRLWRVDAAGGPPEPIGASVPGPTRINAVALDPAGTALSYTAGAVGTSVWMMEHFLPR